MTVHTYTARELRDAGFLDDKAVSIITAHGVPVKVAIPFDERMLKEGLTRAFALHLVENHLIVPAKAAKMVNLSLASFFELMAQYHIPAADYSENELKRELADFS